MGAAKPAAAPAAPAKPKSETVSEFVLFRRSGDDRIPLMSDSELDIVRQARVNAIAGALSSGQARPGLFVVERKCTYPLAGNGKRQGEGSTCEETEL